MEKKTGMIKYIKMLLPAVLTAVLVMDAIFAYEAPDPSKGISPVAPANAASAPNLVKKAQKEKKKTQPAGTAGALAAADENCTYKDGTYTGSATGYGGPVKVRVTIEDGKIAGIKIVSAAGEDASFFNRAKAVIGKILKKQSTNVDAVSGATYSSNGIIKAVRNALDKAKGKSGKKAGKDKNKNKKKKKTGKKEPAKKPAAVTTGDWADGTYTGTGEGFGGTLEVTVVIKNGKIESVAVGKNSDDKEYLSKAENSVIPAIIKKQGTDVDTVSGATYSSVGIIEAVNAALSKAVKKDSAKSGAEAVKDEDAKGDDHGTNESQGSLPGQNKAAEITKTAMVFADEDEEFEDYMLSVTFVINDGKVTDIRNAEQVSNADDNNRSYITSAVRGIKSQLDAKPDMTGIDAVSGATCSSYAVISAGQDALAEYRKTAD